MLIKKGNNSQRLKDRIEIANDTPRARIKIKLKKNNRFYFNQPILNKQLNTTQTINLNQIDDFDDQCCFINTDNNQQIYKKLKNYARDLSIQIIDQTKKDDSETVMNTLAHSKKIILESLKINTSQANNFKTIPFNFSSEEDNPKMIWSQRKQISPMSQLSRQLCDMKPNLTRTQLQTIKQYSTTHMRLTHENKSCSLVNPYTNKEYFHQRVTHTSNNDRFCKKFNTLDYSIIKPNQIKALPLSHRSEPKSIKRKHQRKHFPQLVAALKRKEELERQRVCHQKRIAQIRAKNNTVYLTRANVGAVVEKNEVQPWQVQALTNMPDFI